MNNDFSQIYSNAGLPTGLGSQIVYFPLLMTTGGYYRFVIRATDSHNTADKAHLRKLALQTAPIIYMPIAENYDNSDVTTPGATNAAYYQDPLPDPKSYYAQRHTDLQSFEAVVLAKKKIAEDNIIFVYNHGMPGHIQLTGHGYSYEGAWSAGPDTGYNVRIDDANWSKVYFVLFAGCNTAVTDPNCGNLLTAAHNAGAFLAQGFIEQLTVHDAYNPGGLGSTPDQWSTAFWQYACGYSEDAPYPQYIPTIIGANVHAVDMLMSIYGQTGEYDTYSFIGNSQGIMSLVPAFLLSQ
ncbi:MAG: hypothetical protein IT210_10525 [Armatimonadetes bacterium]|nr:hypothetical protein [Armatimonadota bacterium]